MDIIASDSVCDLSSPLLSVLLKADFTGDDESVFMACTHLVVNIHTHFILWNFIFVERRVGKKKYLHGYHIEEENSM